MIKDPSTTVFRISEIMVMLSCSRDTVYWLIERQKLERVYIREKAPRITGSSYLAYLEEIKSGQPRADAKKVPAPKRPGAGVASTVRDWLGLKP